MKSFQVLDRFQNVQKNTLLEASAGTGKTFSIENIIVRLLIEKEQLTLDQILVVTFTKAAARDLKVRIHSNILNSINCLKNSVEVSAVDYIAQIIEEGDASIQRALRYLERALSGFDLAQVFTIHGFCSQMLADNIFESQFNLDVSDTIESASSINLRGVIRDYFRAGSLEENYSESQLNCLLKEFSGDINALETKLLAEISRGMEIEEKPSFCKLLVRFNQTMTRLKKEYQFKKDKILADFFILAPHYKGIYTIKKEMKPEVFDKIQMFANLFEKDVWDANDLNSLIEDQLSILTILDPCNRKEKAPLHEGLDLTEIIRKHLFEYVNVNEIFAKMAFDCQKAVKRYKDRLESFGYDDFLIAMKHALDRPEFFAKVSAKYKAAIIDEFQDTDPLQREIFERLFLRDSSPDRVLYLVGDPKQSIYSFRQADVYTYLKAAEKIGAENHYSLDTNFRSHSPLIDSLNVLFSEESSPGLFHLPKEPINNDLSSAVHEKASEVEQSQVMLYPKVKSSPKIATKVFSDDKGAVHFFIAQDLASKQYSLEKMESEYFLPFIANEILELVQGQNFHFNQIAILIADRYQADRTAKVLQEWNIPVSLQKTGSLADAAALPALRELLIAILYPKDESAMKIALGGKILRLTLSEVRALEDLQILQENLQKFYTLREDLVQKGFATFFHALLRSCWKKDSYSVMERLLLEEDGPAFLNDLQQIADLLLEQECTYAFNPEALIQFLEEIQSFPEAHEDQIKKIHDPTKNAVHIMTMHVSKGLEFDIVFALGLIKRTKFFDMLIPVKKEGKRFLVPLTGKDSADFKSFSSDLDAEKIRQLYVAMTRAKYRLYNPILFVPLSNIMAQGTASPMDLLLARLGQPPIAFSGIYERMSFYDLNTFKNFIALHAPAVSFSLSLLNELSIPLSRYESKTQVCIKKPPDVVIPGSRRFVQSFTTLSASILKPYRKTSFELPHDYSFAEKNVHTLPAGSDTGNLLHKCLEVLPFEACREMNLPIEFEKWIRPLTEKTPFEGWLDVICEIIFHAVKKPLIDGFSLCDVSSDHCSKEAEFLYESFFAGMPGHLKGMIDLFFFYQDKYYLVDWKSNWLGPDCHYYVENHLKTAMEENDYFLQARLYQEALRKYLRLLDDRPFENIFGGVYYIFLRGLSGGGVYAFS